MKRKLFYHLLIILIVSGTRIFAQSGNPSVFSMSAEYTKLIPTSPEADAMAKYGVIPVTLYTGMPNVSIPIYDIKWGSLTFPISLSYNCNGLKPAEEASRVGMGWCLNANGVITRVVNGQVDESSGARRFDSYPILYEFKNEWNTADSIVKGKIDGEPDVYIFNVNGVTGKFIYINNKIYFSSQQDLKISRIGDDFQIITEDGTIYDFAVKETTATHQINGGFIPSYTSAWLLSSITSKDKKDIITFGYTSMPYQHSVVTTDSYTEKYNGSPNPVSSSFSSNSMSASVTITKELVVIYFGANRVEFLQNSTKRLDIQGVNTDKRALSSICVYDNQSSLIKKYNFTTGYFDTNKKLKLSEVRQVDGNDLLLNRYLFSYYDENSGFPTQLEKGIDRWGYYNGSPNTNLLSSAICPYYAAGNRNPNFSTAKMGVLSSVTYPTGGTTSFVYEPNLYSDGTIQYIYTANSVGSPTFFNNSNNGSPVTTLQNFSLNVGQVINISYSRDIPNFPSTGVKSFYPIIQIINLANDSCCLSRTISYYSLHDAETLYLPKGNYRMIVGCESTAVSTYASIGYKELTGIVPTGLSGPGIRIKTIISDDKISNSTITKNYSYTYDDGASSGHLNFYTGQDDVTTYWISTNGTSTSDGYDITYSADGHSGIGGMTDNEFYYKRVTETISDGTTTGKTTTDFSAIYEVISSVVPTKETQWKVNTTNAFVKAKEARYNYVFFQTKDVLGIKSRLSKYITNGGGGYGYMGFDSGNPDELDILPRTQLYTSYGLPLSFGYYRLTSETEILYADNNVDSTKSTKSYYYVNSKYSRPNGVFEKSSKGEPVLIKSIFPYNDFRLPTSILTPDQIENNYVNAMNTAATNFASGRSNAMNYCLPYVGYYWEDNSFKWRVKTSGAYKSAYFTAYRRASYTRDSSLIVYNNAIDNQISQATDLNTKALLIMQRDHILGSPIEQQSYKKINYSTYLTGAIKSIYSVLSGTIPIVESIYGTELTVPVDSAIYNSNSGNYLKKKIEFTYDGDNKLVQQRKINDVPRSYLWDYHKQYPVAEAINATYTDLAYTSFEGDETSRWSANLSYRNTSYAMTGKNSYDVGYGLSASGPFTSGTHYIISYWSRNGSYNISGGSVINATSGKTSNGWTYYEHEVNSNGNAISITGSGLIDEVRLYPKGAQMSSYTYIPLVGISSQNDVKSNITYYNYDSFGRLVNLLDGDKNKLKEFSYNFVTGALASSLFYNTVKSQSFSKEGCSAGYVGSSVPYTVRAGIYSSSVSQADADQKAQNDLNINGPKNANLKGRCVSTATQTVNVSLSPGTLIGDIGFCILVIRDAGTNEVICSKYTNKPSFLNSVTLPASSNGYYTVSLVPYSSIPLEVTVNNVMKDVYSTQIWNQVSGDITIVISSLIL